VLIDDDDEPMAPSDPEPSVPKAHFRVNLTTAPADFQIYFDEHNYPNGPGMLFPYVPELAQYDRYTIPEVIKKYFFSGFGSDAESCHDSFADLLTAMGNIVNTEFGNVMSHLFAMVDIALTTQTQLCPMIGAGVYDGVFLRGVGYSLKFGGEVRTIGSAEEIKEHIRVFDAHAEALWAFLKKIDIPEETRVHNFKTFRRSHELKSLLASKGIVGGDDARDALMKKAKFLRFPDDKELDPSASNIIRAFDYASDPLKNLNDLP